MTQEFDVKSVIEAAEEIAYSRNPEDKPISVTYPPQSHLSLAIFLVSIDGAAKLRMIREEKKKLKDLADDESLLSILIKKFDDKISDFPDPKIVLDFTRREIDFIGEALVSKKEGIARKGKLQINKMRIPVYKSYLILDSEFVKSGGMPNEELRNGVKRLLGKN